MARGGTLRSAWLPLAVGPLILPTLAPALTTSQSGTILAIDKATGTVVVGDLGPWHGATDIARRTLRVTPSTQLWQVQRATGAGATGWIGDFEQVRLSAADLKAGSFVTAQVQHEGKAARALTLTVVATGER
jgi:hypothetical protein